MGDREKQSRQMAIREELNQHKLYLISERRKGRMHCHARLTAEMVNLPEEFKQTTGYCSKLGASRDEETPLHWKAIWKTDAREAAI